MTRADPIRAKVKAFLTRTSHASVCNDRRWMQIVHAIGMKRPVRIKQYDCETPSEPCTIWAPARYYLEAISLGPIPVIAIEWIDTSIDEPLIQALLVQKAAPSIIGDTLRIWGHVRPGTAPTFLSRPERSRRSASDHA